MWKYNFEFQPNHQQYVSICWLRTGHAGSPCSGLGKHRLRHLGWLYIVRGALVFNYTFHEQFFEPNWELTHSSIVRPRWHDIESNYSHDQSKPSGLLRNHSSFLDLRHWNSVSSALALMDDTFAYIILAYTPIRCHSRGNPLHSDSVTTVWWDPKLCCNRQYWLVCSILDFSNCFKLVNFPHNEWLGSSRHAQL